MAIIKRPKQLKLIENLYAGPNEFWYEDGRPFEGEYHMYDKAVKYYFEGAVWQPRPVAIVPEEKSEFSDPMSVQYTHINRQRMKLEFEKKTIKGPTTTIPQITDKQISKGVISRFLVVQLNSGQVYEIDEDQYKKYKKGGNPYNKNYVSAKLEWKITGPLFSIYNVQGFVIQDGIYERNLQTRRIILEDLPQLSPLLSNPLIFTMPNAENDLYSDGSFLYLDNEKYIGKYHIHPSKGPMAGSTHTASSHSRLKIVL